MQLELVTIPCLADNYAFLLHDADTNSTLLVDAPEAAPIQTVLAARNWQLDHILLTHHHYDHIDGIDDLIAAFQPRIHGAKADAARLPALDVALADGDRFDFAGHTVQVLDVSGHSACDLAYYIADAKAVFTGDSLMALGCGRLFEGTAPQMWQSLSKLAALPPDTQVCSGHEYTMANAAFAVTIEPDNTALAERARTIKTMRQANQPTVPSLLALEQATNPFLRANLPQVKAALNMPNAPDAEVFAEIRLRKDRF